MVSGRITCFERRFCSSHGRQGFTQPHFSLSEEARNTERHHSWNSDLKLRHSHVVFVSAGTSTAEDLNPVIQKSESSDEVTERPCQEKGGAPANASRNQSTSYLVAPDGQLSKMTLNDLEPAPTPRAKSEERFDPMSKQNSVEQGPENAEASNAVFFTDLKGSDDLVRTGLTLPTLRRSLSSTVSDSSGEIIIFAGRRQSCIKGDQKHALDVRSRYLNGQKNQNVSKTSGCRGFMGTVIDDPITDRTQRSPKQRRPIFSPSDPERTSGHFNDSSGGLATTSGQIRSAKYAKKENYGDEILDDYISNIRNQDDTEAFVQESLLNQRDLDGHETAEGEDKAESFTTGRVIRDHCTNIEDWDSADLEDFRELSTSTEDLDSIKQVLSKRERPSGVQYLVIGAGNTVDDARWFPVNSLRKPSAEALIQEFEDKIRSNRLCETSDGSDTSLTIDEQATQDLQDDLEDQEDRTDLEFRRKARMTDERIARLLSKQEELGLGSNDLMLFDGSDFGTENEEGLQLDGLWERAVNPRMPSRSKRAKRSLCNFPSATAFADVLDQEPYNAFDVMDQQRPSLRKMPKGRRGKLSTELSDSELEQSIQSAWEKDRTKKKMRKQEREELRAQGLLGKKSKIDLKAKYPEGISMIDVKNEIRNFLLSSMERYVSPVALSIIKSYWDLVCRFLRCLRLNAKWCMKLPTLSN